jgi:uncharacterized protein (DUF1697 family)
MESYVALVRAINVGGTGKLPMTELRALCETCGFQKVATYIQSGNVVFQSKHPETKVKTLLEEALEKRMGKRHGVLIRTLAEMQNIAARNPFPNAANNQVLVIFLEESPPSTSIDNHPVPGSEQLLLSGRELYIHFPDGMGRSKLKIPFQKTGTGRNLNTLQKLVALLEKLSLFSI